MKHAIFFSLLYAIPFLAITQSPGEKLAIHQSQYPLEKVYIAHDRPYYAPGDTIWCQAFLVEGRSHLAFEEASVLHVDWYDDQGNCLRSMLLKIEEGTAAFEIPTSLQDSSGIYQLRAYTQYQRNFDPAYQFQRSILLSARGPDIRAEKVSKDFSLQFFPEGGYLVNNCQGKVAFLATDPEGGPIALAGLLRKKDGSPIQAIEALHEGMGTFSFTPQPGEKYEVICTYQGQEKAFPLPTPLSEGYQLFVDNRKQDYLEFSVSSSPGKPLMGLQVVGHLRGQVFLDEVIKQKEIYGKRIARADLPTGLIHLTVFDQQDRPVAERLLFSRHPDQNIKVEIQKDKRSFTLRSKVELALKTLQNQQPVEASLSLSVYNSDLVRPQKESLNIQNYLWLQSDLPEPIPNAQQYLQKNDAQSRLFLDYLLLTRGWRRFNWQEVLYESPNIIYPPQQHLAIPGKITKGNRQKPVKADVFLNILDEENFAALNLTTQDDGLFLFSGFDFKDSIEIVLQANEYSAKKQKKRKVGEAKRLGNKDVDIELLEFEELPLEIKQSDIPYLPILKQEEQEQYARAIQNIQIARTSYRDMLTDEIEELEITGTRLDKYDIQKRELKIDFKEIVGYALPPMARHLFTDNLPNKGFNYSTIFEMIRAYFPSAEINLTNLANPTIFYRPITSIKYPPTGALVIVDGGIVPDISAFTPLDVKSISLLSGTHASSLLGASAAGGAVFIITRKERAVLGDQTPAKIKGTLSFTHPGYYAARTFYSPQYPLPKEVAARPDLRTTLYWNPAVQTQAAATSLSFFTGDQTGTFTIQVEGISKGGLPFVHWEEIVVE